MVDAHLWIAEAGPPEGEITSRRYDGPEDAGSEGSNRLTYGVSYYAIRRKREAAESRVRELWERRAGE